MQIEYTGRQVTISKALRGMADEGIERIGKILGKTNQRSRGTHSREIQADGRSHGQDRACSQFSALPNRPTSR